MVEELVSRRHIEGISRLYIRGFPSWHQIVVANSKTVRFTCAVMTDVTAFLNKPYTKCSDLDVVGIIPVPYFPFMIIFRHFAAENNH